MDYRNRSYFLIQKNVNSVGNIDDYIAMLKVCIPGIKFKPALNHCKKDYKIAFKNEIDRLKEERTFESNTILNLLSLNIVPATRYDSYFKPLVTRDLAINDKLELMSYPQYLVSMDKEYCGKFIVLLRHTSLHYAKVTKEKLGQ